MACTFGEKSCEPPPSGLCQSGEMLCNGTCDSSFVACDTYYRGEVERKCIYKGWLCDSEWDCQDGSDEGPHCASTAEKKTTLVMTTESAITKPQRTPYTTTAKIRRSDVNIDAVTRNVQPFIAASKVTSERRTTMVFDYFSRGTGHEFNTSATTTPLATNIHTDTVLESMLRDAPFALPFIAVVGVSLPVIICLVCCVMRHNKKKAPGILSGVRRRQRNDLHMMSLYRYSRHPPERPASSQLTRASSADHVYVDLDTLSEEPHPPSGEPTTMSLPEHTPRTPVQPRLPTRSFRKPNGTSTCWPSPGNLETTKEPMLPKRNLSKANGSETCWPSMGFGEPLKEPMLPMLSFSKLDGTGGSENCSLQDNKSRSLYEPLQRPSPTLPVRTSSKASHFGIQTSRDKNLGSSFTTIAECCAESTVNYSASFTQRGADEFAKSTETDERDSSYVYAKIYPKRNRNRSYGELKVDTRDLHRQTSLDYTHDQNAGVHVSQAHSMPTDTNAYMYMGAPRHPEGQADQIAGDQGNQKLFAYTNMADFPEDQSDRIADGQGNQPLFAYTNVADFPNDQSDHKQAPDYHDYRNQRSGQIAFKQSDLIADRDSQTLTSHARATDDQPDKHAHYHDNTTPSNGDLIDKGTFTSGVASPTYENISDANRYEDTSHFRHTFENDNQHPYLTINNMLKGKVPPPVDHKTTQLGDVAKVELDLLGLACDTERGGVYEDVGNSRQDLSYLHPVFDCRGDKNADPFEYIHPM